jgi:hypothetical protein
MRFDRPRHADYLQGVVKEMDYRIFGALVTLKTTGAITRERFIEERRRNQKRQHIDPMPSPAYLVGPRKPMSFLQRLKWRYRSGMFAK